MWKKSVGALALVTFAILLFVPIASGGTRTVSWNAVTTYTDNTAIEAGNLPVTYDVWYTDNVTNVRVNVASGITSTSATFNDSLMVKGRVYLFSGNAKVKDGSTSADASPYSWTRPFQIPKTQDGITVSGPGP